jgi:hypothetical protein
MFCTLSVCFCILSGVVFMSCNEFLHWRHTGGGIGRNSNITNKEVGYSVFNERTNAVLCNWPNGRADQVTLFNWFQIRAHNHKAKYHSSNQTTVALYSSLTATTSK